MRPAAMGRFCVRRIRRSVLRSSAWFSALAPQVTTAMPASALIMPALNGLDAGAQAAQVEAGRRGDEHHGGDAHLEQRRVVGEQGRPRRRGARQRASGWVRDSDVAVRATAFRIARLGCDAACAEPTPARVTGTREY